MTNREKGLEVMARSITRLEKDLQNPRLDSSGRALLQRLIDERKRILASYQSNAVPTVRPHTNATSALRSTEQRVGPPPLPARENPAKLIPERSIRSLEEKSDTQSNMNELVRLERSNPQFAVPNRPDFIGESLQRQIANYEKLLSSPGLDPYLKKPYEDVLETTRWELADHKTNEQLWADVRQARRSNDPLKIKRAEQALADYLSARLGRIKGKEFPKEMSLQAILKEYDAETNHGKVNKRFIVIAGLILITLFPLGFLLLKLRRS